VTAAEARKGDEMSDKNLSNEVAAQHEIIGSVSAPKGALDYARTTHPDAQWFPQAGLGMFIHWGISSVLGQGDLSWGMMGQPKGSKAKWIEQYGMENVGTVQCSPAKYWEQAKSFNPDRYDPDKWLAAARKAGVKYAVLTTKHHDGFALWPSEYGDFNTKNYAGGQDLVAHYVEACRKHDIKVGLYYSPPDWYWDRDFMSFGRGEHPLDIHHRPCQLRLRTPEEEAENAAKLRIFLRGQLTELLSNYGKIDILWFDGRFPEFQGVAYEDAMLVENQTLTVEEIRALQPGIIKNQRGHLYGDFSTPECKFPDARPEGWWEYCNTFNSGGWGYRKHELYKPAGYFLKNLGESRAWGGNFLANVAPDAHGELPEVYYKRMAEIADWMQENREVVFETEPGSWPEKSNVPITCKGNVSYALIDALSEGNVEIQSAVAPESVKLRHGNLDIPYTYANGTLSFELSGDLQTQLTDVIEITWGQQPV
jgi:alpha-L-fucosidase